MLLSFLLLALCGALVSAIPIDNGVVAYPEVTCGPHSIRVDVKTEKKFQGRIYVKGEVEVPGCSTAGYGEPSYAAPAKPHGDPYAAPFKSTHGPYEKKKSKVSKRSTYGGDASFELGLGACNMRRQRTLYPRGVEYTYTVVVSFHPWFLTKVDRAYRVRCFYMETEKNVNSAMEVSMLTTAGLEQQFPMPTCRYHIKRGSYDGDYVRYAKVGEKVFHVWECDQVGAYIYGLLVKNCYVDDGKGNKFELIDTKGCSTDRHLVPDISYSDKLLKAYVESHVFKYADNPQLYFQCTIELCFKNDGGCKGVTPPHCTYGEPSYAPPIHVPAPHPAPVYAPPHPVAPHPAPAYPAAPVHAPVPHAAAPYAVDLPVYAPPPVVYAPPVPVHGLPYKDAAPIKAAERRRREALSAAASATEVDSNATGPVSRARELLSNLLEADISAQPIIVLPFEDDADLTEETAEDLAILRSTAGSRLPVRSLVLADGTDAGLCLSSSGFGILLALFITLFVFSAILTILIVRTHLREKYYSGSKF